MTITRYIASGVAAFGLLTASTAFAGETRSASALPSAKVSLKRVNGISRKSKEVKDASHVIEGTSLIVLLVGGAAVIGGTIAIATASDG